MRRLRSLPKDTALVEAEINLTPLIDVVFVVLIIFIIIAPMVELDRVELATGASQPEKTKSFDESSVAIYVKQDNTIWYGGKCVDAAQLTRLLQQARQAAQGDIPQLFQDERANFGTYQRVKNAVEMAGYEEIDVILKPH